MKILNQTEKPAKLNGKDFFAIEHLKADLKRQSIRGGAVTLITQASKFAIQMASTVFIARLLTPEDYGLIAMASVVIKFVQMFNNFGLSTAIVQKSQINHQQVSTLFWINTAISTVIGLLIAALSTTIAGFYQEPRLVNIMLILSLVFIMGGLTIQHQALLRRQMRFTRIAQIELFSMIFGVMAGIIAALLDAGYWALVILQVAMGVSYNLGFWLSCSWRPGWPVWNSGVGSLLAFGGNLTAFNFVNYFSRNLDNILIGRYWGSQELGLYAKAYQLLLLPIQQINTPISSVALPTLSRLQSQPESYRRYYYKAILAITTVSMPLVAFTFAAADQIILLLLGSEWLGVVPIFRWLMPAAFMGTFNIAGGWVYQSLGRTDRQLRIGVVMSAIDIGIFLISVRWGALGVAAAYGFSRPILWVPRILYCFQGTPIKFTKLLATLSYPAIASLGSAALLMCGEGLSILPEKLSTILSLLLSCLLYILFYLVIWSILPRGRKILWEMLQMLREFKAK
ncbi:lipopolysaccharide biosynthesis protein [Myxosarcina sp. GI1(2024)]